MEYDTFEIRYFLRKYKAMPPNAM